VHQQFWDGVNFARGANPPREQWKAPPQRPAEETEGAFNRFGEYIDYIRAIPGVKWITAADLPSIYADGVRHDGASEPELNELAKRILNTSSNAIDFQVIGSKSFSAADQFELLTVAVAQMVDGKNLKLPLKAQGLFGPDGAPPASADLQQLNWPAFRDAVRDVRESIAVQQRVPARVFMGADPISPTDFLVALAFAYDFHQATHRFPETEGVKLGSNTTMASARFIAKDTPNLFGGWVIHKEGFRAPKILEVARLQAWTLKPAIRNR
jgi:hypothetical protein